MKMSTMSNNVVTKNDSSIKERWVRVEKLVGVKWMENLDGESAWSKEDGVKRME